MNETDAIGPYFGKVNGVWAVTNMDGNVIATFNKREEARKLFAYLNGIDDPDSWELKCANPLTQP